MSVSLGNTNIGEIYLGNTKISKAYLGSDLVYTNGFPVTYLADEHVQCTGDAIYIPGGTGITLQTAYDTYYRISGYDVTGGTVENGVLIPTGPCTVKAVEKVNYFTASGGWEKGSNVEVPKNGIYTTNGTMTSAVPTKYATITYSTDNVPTTWYSTNSRWNVNSTVSAYSITLHPIMHFTSYGARGSAWASQVTAQSLIGSTVTQSQSYSQATGSHMDWRYNKTFTTNETGVNYGISAKILGTVKPRGNKVTVYVANDTTGTWTATGIAP